jgi:hypothetical protein
LVEIIRLAQLHDTKYREWSSEILGEKMRLFKFRSLAEGEPQEHTLDILRNQRLRFASPMEFNDPFDCNFPLDMTDGNGKETVRRACKSLLAEMVKDEESSRDWGHLKYALEDDAALVELANDWHWRYYMYGAIISDLGIISFCDEAKTNDALMWSHYANFHNGICFEFEMEESWISDDTNGHKITYSDSIKPLTEKDFMNFGWGTRMVTTKSKVWSYESEYRLVRFHGAGEFLHFAKTSLKAVYIGLKVYNDLPMRITGILREKEYSAKVFWMTTHDNRLELHATEKNRVLTGNSMLVLRSVQDDFKRIKAEVELELHRDE